MSVASRGVALSEAAPQAPSSDADAPGLGEGGDPKDYLKTGVKDRIPPTW